MRIESLKEAEFYRKVMNGGQRVNKMKQKSYCINKSKVKEDLAKMMNKDEENKKVALGGGVIRCERKGCVKSKNELD